jgi:hypothetical protein
MHESKQNHCVHICMKVHAASTLLRRHCEIRSGLHNLVTCGSNVPQEHFANPHQRATHRTRVH